MDAILLEVDGEYAFVDGGYRRNGQRAVSYMRMMGVKRLKYYVASHAHKNHIAAASVIIGAIRTDAIVIPRIKALDAILRYAETTAEVNAVKAAGINVLHKGDSLALGSAVIECIGPERQRNCPCGAYSENLNSLILRVDDYRYGYPARLLLTGDTSASIIAKCGAEAKALIMKSPHHAGTQPASLLKQVKPKAVIVCSNVGAGKTYRARIAKAGASLYNACDGRVVIDPASFTEHTYISDRRE